MIYWGSLKENSISADLDAYDWNPELRDLEEIIVEGADSFCVAWEIERPVIRFSTNPDNRSCYNFKSRTITISIEEAQLHVLNAATEISNSNAMLIAARLCLFHELTHLVQDNRVGYDQMLADPLLFEAHADLFGAYWLTPEISDEVIAVLPNIAFVKGGRAEQATHPFGCVRKSSVIAGMGMGITVLSTYGDISIPSCGRSQLFEDSLATATNILKFTNRPCDPIPPSVLLTQSDRCRTCPFEINDKGLVQ